MRHRYSRVIGVVLCVGVLGLAACGGAPEPAPVAESVPDPEPAAPVTPPPDVVTAERGGFIPEGVEYDQMNGRLLTGSLVEGTVFHIENDGAMIPLVEDPELVSSVGIEADEPRNRLLVANADRAVFQGGVPGHAKLGVYNLTTGDPVAMVDLAAAIPDAPDDAAYFANDVTVGDDGTAYVTDTRMGVIYEVDLNYEPTVLYRFDPAAGVAPNGLVYHASGYLLVGAGETLYKIPIDQPEEAMPVALPEPVPGQDGLVWASDGRLVIVSNSGNRAVALTSDDEWMTATLAGVATYEMQATTAAAVGDAIYVVHPHFGDEDPPSLARVTFE